MMMVLYLAGRSSAGMWRRLALELSLSLYLRNMIEEKYMYIVLEKALESRVFCSLIFLLLVLFVTKLVPVLKK